MHKAKKKVRIMLNPFDNFAAKRPTGFVSPFDAFLKRPQGAPAEPPVTGNTPLHTWLIERGKKKLLATDLSSVACEEADVKQYFLSRDCQDMLVQNSIGQSPLHIACEHSDVSAAKAILEKYKELGGFLPEEILLCGHASAAIKSDEALALSELLNLKESKLDRTPLHVACSQEHFCPAIIILLVGASHTSSHQFSSASPQPSSCLLAKDKNGEIPLQLLVRELAMFPRAGNWSYRPPPAMLSPEVGVIGVDPSLQQQSLLLKHVEEPFKKLVDATILAGLFPSVKTTDSNKEESGAHKQNDRFTHTSRTRIDVGHPINMTGNKSHLPVLSMLALEKELLPLMQYLIEKSVVTVEEVKSGGEQVITVASQHELKNEKKNGEETMESTVPRQRILCVDPTARSTKKSFAGLMSIAECTTPLHVAVVTTSKKSIPLMELLLNYIDTYSIRVCQLCGVTAVLGSNAEESQKQTCACRYDSASDASPCGGALVHPIFARDVDGNTVLHACTGVTSDSHGGSPFPSIPVVELLFFHREANLSVLNFAKSRAPTEFPPWMMGHASSDPDACEGTNTDGTSLTKLRSAVTNLDELDGQSPMSCFVKIASDKNAISLIHNLLLCASTSGSLPPLTRVNRRIAVQEKRAREAASSFMRREVSVRKTLREEEEQFNVDEEEIKQDNADDGSGDLHDYKDSSTQTKTLCENKNLSSERPLLTPARLGFYDPNNCSPSMTQEKFYGRCGSPLVAAVKSCNTTIMALLLASGMGDINERCAEDGSTILHQVTLSVCRGRNTISDAFLIAKYGCDFTARDGNGRTALDWALWLNEKRKKSYEESESDSDEDTNQYAAQMVEWLQQHMGPTV